MGFSVVSVVEILYFITLRLFCRRYYGGRHSKNIRNKKINTISRLISKNQRNVWPFVWNHAQNVDQIKINNNSMLQAYSRQLKQHGVQANGWKAPTPTIVYPYLD